jgi:hypothetical protein
LKKKYVKEKWLKKVNPINSYSEEEINQASRDLLLKHASFSSNGKILRQVI